MADFVFSKIGKLTLPVLSQAIFLLSPSALKREIEVSPLEKGIDLLCFLKRQEHPSFPRTLGKALGGALPEALAEHRSQGSILGQEGGPRRNTARFANVLLCPPRPWPALGAAQPSSPPPLPSHTRFGTETPALVQTPSLDSRFLSKPNQIPPMWGFSAPVSGRQGHSNDFSGLLLTVPPERLSRRRAPLPARMVYRGIEEQDLSAADPGHRPPLPPSLLRGSGEVTHPRRETPVPGGIPVFFPKGIAGREGGCSRAGVALFPKNGKPAPPFPAGAPRDPCERCLPRGGRAARKPSPPRPVERTNES